MLMKFVSEFCSTFENKEQIMEMFRIVCQIARLYLEICQICNEEGRQAWSDSYAQGSPEPTLLFATPKLPDLKGGTYALPAFDSMISVHIKLHGTFDPTEESAPRQCKSS